MAVLSSMRKPCSAKSRVKWPANQACKTAFLPKESLHCQQSAKCGPVWSLAVSYAEHCISWHNMTRALKLEKEVGILHAGTWLSTSVEESCGVY